MQRAGAGEPPEEAGPARLPAALSALTGRDQEVAEVTELLRDGPLVTVTGPGGVGKTRLAVEVARGVAGQFPDGVRFVGLGAVTDEAQVPAAVAAALGIAQVPGTPPSETLAAALAAQRLLLVLDNCEQVLGAVAELTSALLKEADDLRILATSREQLWIGGEIRYRLSPLALPGAGQQAEVERSAAVALFAERARRADPRFALTPELAPLAARIVTSLDGMPLAIELAAARVEALGLSGLADRIDDALRLLAGRDVTAAGRHQSLAAVAEWSYRLLSPAEQRAFQRLAAFPGPFTLEAAEAIAGADAALAVLRLVDCSLVTPPQTGPDQRVRYSLLQTLRAYGLTQLAGGAETAAALAGYALTIAEQAAVALEQPGQELTAARWLDAEDATLGQAVSWTLEHDPERALRLTGALAPWWRLRGRLVEGYQWLAAAAGRCTPGTPGWARAQLWLGHLAQATIPAAALAHYDAACADHGTRESVDALAGRAVTQLNYGNLTAADSDARQVLALARQAGYQGGEAQALIVLAYSALSAGAQADALDWGRQAEELLGAPLPGWLARWCSYALMLMLTQSGEHDAARRVCGDSLTRSREVGDLADLTSRLTTCADLERRSGNLAAGRMFLREAVELAIRVGERVMLRNCLWEGAAFSAEAGRWADAVTLRAAHQAELDRAGVPAPLDEQGPAAPAAGKLPAGQAREAAERGARMTLTAAAEFVTLLTAPEEASPARTEGALTGRERELVTLVAQGRTNGQIAEQLFISVRTVSSHLDRVRAKTGCRRRADLTRLALSEGLV